MSLTVGPFHFRSFAGDLLDLASGRENPEALRNLDDRLPQPNSLRRGSPDTKCAVLTAAELLRAEGVPISERIGLYVGQQLISLDYCSEFLRTSYREGPRMASPLHFSESVANNVATHLSLTLGIKSIAQTFIGSRAAGIQALMAAAEDVESGLIDVGLVIVMGVATSTTLEAYQAVLYPFRRQKPPEAKFLRGSMALFVRREARPHPRLTYAGTRCMGPDPRSQLTVVGSIWTEAEVGMPPDARILASTMSLAPYSRAVIGRIGPTIPSLEGIGDSFALDPFLRLLLDGVLHPGPQGRAVLCLGEDGTAGMVVLDGPGVALKV
jgi:hypothetical protein